MFCGKCGVSNEEGVVFCKECGERIIGDNPDPVAIAAVQAAKKNKKVGIIAVFVAGLILAMILFLLFGRSYKTTAKKFMNAMTNFDIIAACEFMPPQLLDYLEDDDNWEMVEEFAEEFREYADDYDVEMSYKLLDAEDLRKSEIATLEETLEDEFDCKIKISAAKIVPVRITIEEDGDTNRETLNLTIIKVGGKWYIDPISADFDF